MKQVRKIYYKAFKSSLAIWRFCTKLKVSNSNPPTSPSRKTLNEPINQKKKKGSQYKINFLSTLIFKTHYPHLEEPQSLQVRQPSWYIKFSDLQFSQVWPLACVPSST